VVGAASAAVTILIGGTAGAGDQPGSTVGVSANAISARALSATPQTVNLASVPKASAAAGSATPQAMPFLSPLGKAGLAQAKANAAANAPSASEFLPSGPERVAGTTSVPAGTPGGALTGFDGMANSGTICSYFGSGGCQPPDHGVSASDLYVVQVVNTSIAIYSTAGALQSGYPKSLQAAFGVPAPSPSGCDSAHNNQPFLSDPRTFRDPVTGRFWVAFLQVEGAFGLSPNCTFVSRYWVAVSATSDPRGSWHVYAFNTANLVGSPSAADYTQLGFNGQAAFIGGNQFNQAGTAYNGAWTLAIPKATAEAGGSISGISGFGHYTASDGTATRLLDTVQPVASYGDGYGGPATEFLVSSFNESITESKVVVWAFSNPLSTQGHGQTISGVVINTAAYAQPPLADNFPSCTNCLETIDTRVSATPVYMHGKIYATHDSAVNNGTATNANVHWMVIQPVLNQFSVSGCTACGTITGATAVVDNNYLAYAGTTDTWFGTMQPDREGNLFLAYEYGSTSFSTSPSSVYIARRATGAPGGWPDNGFFLRVGSGATSNTRWGDYEATAFQSWNSDFIWFATEWSNGNWGTRLSKVKYIGLVQATPQG
jgi:hypothetical protein